MASGCSLRCLSSARTHPNVACQPTGRRWKQHDVVIGPGIAAQERPSALACSLSACQTYSMTRQPKRPITYVSLHHSHDSSWPASADWLDLRNHLVKTHGALPHDIDDLESYTDGTTGRRRHAEDRHQALHLAPQPASGG